MASLGKVSEEDTPDATPASVAEAMVERKVRRGMVNSDGNASGNGSGGGDGGGEERCFAFWPFSLLIRVGALWVGNLLSRGTVTDGRTGRDGRMLSHVNAEALWSGTGVTNAADWADMLRSVVGV